MGDAARALHASTGALVVIFVIAARNDALSTVRIRLIIGSAHVTRLIGLRRARQMTGFTIRDLVAILASAATFIIPLTSAASFIALIFRCRRSEAVVAFATFRIARICACDRITVFDGFARFALFTVTVLAILAAAGRLAARSAQTGLFVQREPIEASLAMPNRTVLTPTGLTRRFAALQFVLTAIYIRPVIKNIVTASTRFATFFVRRRLVGPLAAIHNDAIRFPIRIPIIARRTICDITLSTDRRINMWFAIGKTVVAVSTGIALTASSIFRRETLHAVRALCKVLIAAGAMRKNVAARLFNALSIAIFDVIGIALIAAVTSVSGGAQSAFVTSPALIAFGARSKISIACFAMWTDVGFAILLHAIGESLEAGRTLVAEACRRAGVAGLASLAMRYIGADGAMSTDASGGRAIDCFTFASAKRVAFGATFAHARV
jgi:hypothetical protein